MSPEYEATWLCLQRNPHDIPTFLVQSDFKTAFVSKTGHKLSKSKKKINRNLTYNDSNYHFIRFLTKILGFKDHII